MSKFTPGPWEVKFDEDGFFVQAVSLCGEDEAMAVYLTPSTVEDGDINKADAQLIAAAPEMYEALKVALNQLEIEAKENEWLGDDDAWNVIEKIKQSLAKAEGNQS